MTSKIIYEGYLRTKATHIHSGNDMITDAPIDINGKGEYFSPTDLLVGFCESIFVNFNILSFIILN